VSIAVRTLSCASKAYNALLKKEKYLEQAGLNASKNFISTKSLNEPIELSILPGTNTYWAGFSLYATLLRRDFMKFHLMLDKRSSTKNGSYMRCADQTDEK
jgi:hypothetical protein